MSLFAKPQWPNIPLCVLRTWQEDLPKPQKSFNMTENKTEGDQDPEMLKRMETNRTQRPVIYVLFSTFNYCLFKARAERISASSYCWVTIVIT